MNLIAPGENINSTWNDGLYKSESGTSMATPFVTGAVAQMLTKWGDMTPAQAKQHLMRTARRLPLPGVYQGAGIVDLQQLLTVKPA